MAIRKYSESTESVEELTQLAELHLGSLKDKDFRIKCEYMGSSNCVRISKNSWTDSFTWEEIEEYAVPFTKALSENYTLDKTPINIQYKVDYSVEDIINGFKPIVVINFYVSNEI
jgi:hypothetical protein